jgi:small subunit ribosomal protein S6
MYILNATLSDEARNRALDKIKAGITEHGGEIHKLHELGRRKLAYPIDKKREGYYYVIFFSVDTAAINEMWRDYHLNEDLIRFMTLQTEKVEEEIKHLEIIESA